MQILFFLRIFEVSPQSSLECILHSFPVQYIGKELSVTEYKNSNICESRVCMRDSKSFIAYASLRNDSDPFHEFRATNDRHS